jgi:hypothetical protein
MEKHVRTQVDIPELGFTGAMRLGGLPNKAKRSQDRVLLEPEMGIESLCCVKKCEL